MEEKLAQEGKEMPTKVQVEDKLGKKIIDKQRNQLESEIDVFTQNLAGLAERKKDFLEQFELDKKIQDMQQANFTKNKDNVWAFDLMPEYWELQKQKQAYSIRMNRHMGDAKLQEFDREYEAISAQYKSSKEALDGLSTNSGE